MPEGGASAEQPIETGLVIDRRWTVGRRIGAGSFGEIYMGDGPNGAVAIKFEKKTLRCPQLRHECKVYRELAGCVGVCNVHQFGTVGDHLSMVLDFLGPSLEDLFTKCNRRFSLRTTLQLADQLLERLTMFHNHHLIHRDVKPANFVLGAALDSEAPEDESKRRLVYVIDFGLSKRYRHPRNLTHIPFRDGRSLTGTPRYASINNHMGIESSRRDDLESVGYILVYFLVGKLPWQGLRAPNTAQKHQVIMNKKVSTSIEELCVGLPHQFADFLRYCRSLKFDAAPNMTYLRGLFQDLYKERYKTDMNFTEWDWDRDRESDQRPMSHGKAKKQAKASQQAAQSGDTVGGAGGGVSSKPGRGQQATAEPRSTEQQQQQQQFTPQPQQQQSQPPPSQQQQQQQQQAAVSDVPTSADRAQPPQQQPQEAGVSADEPRSPNPGGSAAQPPSSGSLFAVGGSPAPSDRADPSTTGNRGGGAGGEAGLFHARASPTRTAFGEVGAEGDPFGHDAAGAPRGSVLGGAREDGAVFQRDAGGLAVLDPLSPPPPQQQQPRARTADTNRRTFRIAPRGNPVVAGSRSLMRIRRQQPKQSAALNDSGGNTARPSTSGLVGGAGRTASRLSGEWSRRTSWRPGSRSAARPSSAAGSTRSAASEDRGGGSGAFGRPVSRFFG